MDENVSHRCRILACGVFEPELTHLAREGRMTLPMTFIPSRLHMVPDQLNREMSAKIDRILEAGEQVLLVFGDCHSRMAELAGRARVERVRGINCPDILLGQETYRRLRKQGVFFLMADWAVHWRDIFQTELGLEGTVARMFMQDMHDRLLYLDTGVIPPPLEHLKAMSRFSGLPYEILSVSLDTLVRSVATAHASLVNDGEA